MTRADELTAKLLDGALADAEWAELAALLAADPTAEADHLALLELEAALRGLRTGFDLAGPTLEKVKEAQAEKTARGVMAEIATQPAPAWAARPAPAGRRADRRGWVLAAAGLLAVAAGLVVGIWFGTGHQTPPDGDPAPTIPGYARVTRALGEVELLTPRGDAFRAAEGSEIPPEYTLRTVGEESHASVELPDRTTVDIEPESVVRFLVPRGAAARSRVFLAAGQLTAAMPEEDAERQLVVATGVAEVFARTGIFVVSSLDPGSARVDIKRGKVEVVRANAPAPVPVTRGAAVVRSGSEKVLIEPVVRVDRTPARTLPFPNPRDAVFSPDGSEVWVASARQFTRWTRDGGTADTVFPNRKGSAAGPAAAFTRDKGHLITGFAVHREEKAARDERVLVRDLPGGGERRELPVKLPEARLWAAGPDAAWFALADPRPNNRRVRVVDGSGAQRFERVFEQQVGCVAASADGRVLAVGLSEPGRGENNRVVLLDPATGDRLGVLPVQRRGVAALAFSADGRRLAAGFNGHVQVWDVRSRELVKSVAGFERAVNSLTFSPNGELLAGSTPDGLVWVWSVATGRPVQLIEVAGRGIRAVAFSPDGRRLVTVANTPPVALWDVADPTAAGGTD